MKPFLLSLLLAPAAFAHDTFLVADSMSSACGGVIVHLTSGMQFPTLDSAIQPDRVTRATAATHRRIQLTPVAAAHSLDFHVDVPEQGIAVVAVELAPKTLELTPDKVLEYLDDVAASDAIRKEWKSHPGRWRETYTKHAKAFLRCGAPDREWNVSQDIGFELFPQLDDPTSLKAGETLNVIAVRGRLLLDFPIILQRDGGPRVVAKTDRYGFAKFTIPGPGRYMLSATDLRRSDSKDVDWVSDFTTLTFEIK